MVLRRSVTVAVIGGITYARANVWTAKGASSKTFLTHAEASAWVPRS